MYFIYLTHYFPLIRINTLSKQRAGACCSLSNYPQLQGSSLLPRAASFPQEPLIKGNCLVPSGNPSKLHQIDQIRFAKREFPLKRLFPGVLYLVLCSPSHCLLPFLLIFSHTVFSFTWRRFPALPRSPGISERYRSFTSRLHITTGNLSELLHLWVT